MKNLMIKNRRNTSFLFEISAKISYEKKDKKETGVIIVIMINPVFYLVYKSNSRKGFIVSTFKISIHLS